MRLYDLDAWICGDNDPNAPFNQLDSEADLPITDLMEDGLYDEAFGKISELRDDLTKIRNIVQMINKNIDKTDNVYLLKRLNRAIQSI